MRTSAQAYPYITSPFGTIFDERKPYEGTEKSIWSSGNDIFHFWNRLSSEQRLLLSETAQEQAVKKGELMHGGDRDCIGLVIVKSGLLRAYMLTEEGRELTLYRLYEGDICLFSASCIISGIHFDVMVEAEENGVVLHIPPEVYKRLMDTSLDASNYTNQLMAERFRCDVAAAPETEPKAGIPSRGISFGGI